MKKNVKFAWAVFILLGAGMYFVRYRGILPGEYLRTMITWGPYVVLGIHVMLVLRAFQDSIFHGILALLVPLYSFYWLFAVSDDFLIRAVVAGLLVGLGQDSAIFYQQVLSEVMANVNQWISSGGGDVTRKTKW